MKTLEDYQRVMAIADRLQELGIQKKTCGEIRHWAGKEVTKILKPKLEAKAKC